MTQIPWQWGAGSRVAACEAGREAHEARRCPPLTHNGASALKQTFIEVTCQKKFLTWRPRGCWRCCPALWLPHSHVEPEAVGHTVRGWGAGIPSHSMAAHSRGAAQPSSELLSLPHPPQPPPLPARPISPPSPGPHTAVTSSAASRNAAPLLRKAAGRRKLSRISCPRTAPYQHRGFQEAQVAAAAFCMLPWRSRPKTALKTQRRCWKSSLRLGDGAMRCAQATGAHRGGESHRA